MKRLEDGNVELCRLFVAINNSDTRVNIYVRKWCLLLVLNLTKENKKIKVKKKLRKSHPNFYHRVKKIEAQAKMVFLYKEKRVF